MQKNDDTCGGTGSGRPVGNGPLFHLHHLIATVERQQEEKHRATVKRIIISEIEKHMRSPRMRKAGDYWHEEERRSLCDLLVMLKSGK
jgi:hypothetical protein